MHPDRLTEYLKRRMPHATDLRVINLVRIPGGSSRETYSFDVEWTENGERNTRPMIGRRDPLVGCSSRSADANTKSSMRCIAPG